MGNACSSGGAKKQRLQQPDMVYILYTTQSIYIQQDMVYIGYYTIKIYSTKEENVAWCEILYFLVNSDFVDYSLSWVGWNILGKLRFC